MSDNVENVFEYVQEKIAEYRQETLVYYFDKEEEPVIFSKNTIDTLGVIRNKKSGRVLSYGNGVYNQTSVIDDAGKRRSIFVGRAVASTFMGAPPTPAHTADHINSKQKKNDTLENIRWLDKKRQSDNRDVPETYKSANIIVKDGVEKTSKEWVAHMNEHKAPEQREYTVGMIKNYAIRKQYGFAYKEYPDLPGEVWRPVKVPGDENEVPEKGTTNGKGEYWKISNKNRVKFITNHAENILEGDRLGLLNGYPNIRIDNKSYYCHVLAFMMFRETEWAARNPGEIVLHEKDDKLDFRPEKLRLGTQSDNTKDSYDNRKRDGTKTARMKCASYINGVFEKDYESQTAAAKFIKSKGLSNASVANVVSRICSALSGDCNTTYKRTWKKL
ncbi:hypothetical protein PBCVNEJV1_254L [Paramecium bursaria Chlorella virus NE-JV-1]|nr:hypothetical protein PBCVNEJV1_254L [Paramecium bursaria Chlorella virus NE-JV-1]